MIQNSHISMSFSSIYVCVCVLSVQLLGRTSNGHTYIILIYCSKYYYTYIYFLYILFLFRWSFIGRLLSTYINHFVHIYPHQYHITHKARNNQWTILNHRSHNIDNSFVPVYIYTFHDHVTIFRELDSSIYEWKRKLFNNL